MANIIVQNTKVTILGINGEDFISLSNMENLNAVFIEQRMPQFERLIKLNQIAIHQISVLESNNNDKKLQK